MLERVDRKSLIYEMGGSGAYAATHVVGCSHGCRFPCYAFLMMRRFGKVATYEEWCRPRLVGNALKLAQRELPRLRGTAHSISLSFATDAFMYNQPEVTELTLRLTRLINSYDIPVHILTKGVITAEALELSSANQFGITLVSVDEAFRQRFEPGAAPYAERVASLRRAHERGFTCFVNMEPYPTPNIWKQDIQHILDTVDFTDDIRLGQLNYNDAVQEYPDWRGFYERTGSAVAAWCEAHSIAYDGPGAKRKQPHSRRSVDSELLFKAEV